MMPLCRPLVDVLKHRGIGDPERFLAPSTWSDMPSPFLMEGMEQAVGRILEGVRSQQRIAVFGDYDCDGTLSAAILQATLRKLEARPVVYLPHRDEGYGFSDEAVHRFSRNGTDLIITIDNGINAAGPVRLARRLAMDVVIIDHHHIETRADAPAVWSDRFCVAGLGLMVCWALLETAGLPNQQIAGFVAGLSRLAAIASIADCVPLTGATRTLTKIGLAELGRTRHAGLRKLLLMAGVRSRQSPTSEQIAFRIAPRINAAGRVGHPVEVLRMLSAASPEQQIELALTLDRLNHDRRSTAPSPFNSIVLEAYGGAVARVANDATAFGHRDAMFKLLILAISDNHLLLDHDGYLPRLRW
jgi:single-stranded-DNA-specific exonuclease